MSFSKIIGMTKGKVDVTRQKPYNISSDLSFGGDNHNDCATFISKPQDVNDTNISKMSKFSTADYMLPLAAPSNETDTDEDCHAVPWMSCPIAEHHSEFAENELVMENNMVSLEKRSNSNHVREFDPSNCAATVPIMQQEETSKKKGISTIPDAVVPQQSEALCLKDNKSGRSMDQLCGTVPNIVLGGEEKILDPRTSSVYSASSSERASNDPAYDLKRKCYETEDSEDLSNDADEESVGVRETFSYYASSKRRRASKVHNSSEWRWRDRVNEKMRALQELIPNCNKLDQASLLDEAMKYLQTLQLQWQSLSMGTGIYMSPMMLQATMQQALGPYMPQFSPMGMMGGFGMGMHDANSSMAPMHTVQSPCYPVPNHPISTPMCHGAVGYSPQSVGYPGQEQLTSMTRVPLPIFGSPSVMPSIGNVAGMPNMVMNDKSN